MKVVLYLKEVGIWKRSLINQTMTSDNRMLANIAEIDPEPTSLSHAHTHSIYIERNTKMRVRETSIDTIHYVFRGYAAFTR